MEVKIPTLLSCSFCLSKITKEQVKQCGNCMKRIYCSKKCQITDWKKKGNKDQEGQGHSTWCGVVDYGEEFVDWIILPIPGKGDGIIALRNLPLNYRIIIDGFGIADILNNNIKGRDNKLFHSTKINHSCDPNCARFMDAEFKVAIVYAMKEIKIGEELTINYYSEMADPTNIRNLFSGQTIRPFTFTRILRDFDRDRKRLYQEHNIICNFSCFCFKPEVVSAVREMKEVELRLANLGDGVEIDELVRKLINRLMAMGADPMFRAFILESGVHNWGNCDKNKNLVRKWVEETSDIYEAILHPKSSIICRVKGQLLL